MTDLKHSRSIQNNGMAYIVKILCQYAMAQKPERNPLITNTMDILEKQTLVDQEKRREYMNNHHSNLHQCAVKSGKRPNAFLSRKFHD